MFSVGMTLLQTALLKDSIDCYDFNKYLFEEHRLDQMLISLDGKYSGDFMDVLMRLVEI